MEGTENRIWGELILALLCAAAFVLAITACGTGESTDTGQQTDKTESALRTTPEPTKAAQDETTVMTQSTPEPTTAEQDEYTTPEPTSEHPAFEDFNANTELMNPLRDTFTDPGSTGSVTGDTSLIVERNYETDAPWALQGTTGDIDDTFYVYVGGDDPEHVWWVYAVYMAQPRGYTTPGEEEDRQEESATWWLSYIASISYRDADSDAAQQWVVETLPDLGPGGEARTQIGGAEFHMYTNNKKIGNFDWEAALEITATD